MPIRPLELLLQRIEKCILCEPNLGLGANPVLRASSSAKILIAGQAPGVKVHQTSIPFNDASGERLRQWMGIDKKVFYDQSKIAIIPMAFCYPGKGRSGDRPPPKLCSITWHKKLLALMPDIQLTLLIGQYAQRYHLGASMKDNLTETVRSWQQYAPSVIPLPHPSPRNNIWLKKNPWFEKQLLGYLRLQVSQLS